MNKHDEFAEMAFQLVTSEVEENLAKISSDALGATLVPLLMESSVAGRTRTIRIKSLHLLKKVLGELSTREDCSMVAVEKPMDKGMPTEEEIRAEMDKARESGVGVQALLDAIEEKIQAEEKAAKDLENVSVDAILNTPMHPDVAGR